MKKWAMWIAALMLCLSVATAMAEVKFDISVFQNNENYNVEFDEMDDTGEITSTEGNVIFGGSSDDEGYVIGDVDIKIIENYPPVMRATLLYSGEDWIFTDKVILKPAETRYTFEVSEDTDVSDGKIYESFTLIFTDESIQMIKDMIDADNFIIKMRLDGDRKVDGTLMFDKEKLTQMYNDYLASGALENDFARSNKLDKQREAADVKTQSPFLRVS